MYKNFIILGQSIVIGVLALTLIINSFFYNVIKNDRDEWAEFTISAYSECEFECKRCIDSYASDYRMQRKEISY
jgi:hypothetical protein